MKLSRVKTVRVVVAGAAVDMVAAGAGAVGIVEAEEVVAAVIAAAGADIAAAAVVVVADAVIAAAGAAEVVVVANAATEPRSRRDSRISKARHDSFVPRFLFPRHHTFAFASLLSLRRNARPLRCSPPLSPRSSFPCR